MGLVTVAPGLTHSQSTDACQAVHCGSASAALCAGCADTHSHSLWSDALLPALATMRICCALPPVMACPVLDHKDPEEESASSMSHAASNVLHGSQTAKCPVSLQASGDDKWHSTPGAVGFESSSSAEAVPVRAFSDCWGRASRGTSAAGWSTSSNESSVVQVFEPIVDPAWRTHLHNTLMHDLNESVQFGLSYRVLASLQFYKAIPMLDEVMTRLYDTT